MKKKYSLIIAVLLLAVFLFWLQKQTLSFDIEQIKNLIRSFGIFGPLVFILLNIITIVFSPLTSFPFWVASLALFGFWPTFFYIYFSHSLGSLLNFWIARKLGRPVVVKFVGNRGMKKIDEITEMVGLKTLFLARLVGGAATDYVSYAAGLTSIKFKPYALISVLAHIPVMFVNVLILDKALSLQPKFIFLLGIWGYLLAIGFPVLIYKRTKNKNLTKEGKKVNVEIEVIRGIVLSAEKAQKLDEKGTLDRIAGEHPKFTMSAPIDPGQESLADGLSIVVIGAPVGPAYGHEFGVLRVEEQGEAFTLMDGYRGTPEKAPFRCQLSDEEIVAMLQNHGINCRVEDIATYIVASLN